MPKQVKTEEVVIEKDTRDLAIRKRDSFGNYEIYREGGGVVPKSLEGMYTSPSKAQSRLDGYYETQGFINEQKKIKDEIKTIHPLDHQEYKD